MVDLNVAVLTGRIAAEPQLVEKGTLRVCRLKLAGEAVRRDRKTGELENYERFFSVAVFGEPGVEAAKLRLGTRVGITGQLNPRQGERETEVTTTEWVREIGPAVPSEESLQERKRPALNTRQGPPSDALDW
jgi:single-stranded DNA-binding protein